MSTNVLETVKKVIIKTLNLKKMPAEIPDTAMIYEDLGIDSVDSLDLVLNLEEEFGIKIPNTDRSFMKDVSSLSDKIQEFLGN